MAIVKTNPKQKVVKVYKQPTNNEKKENYYAKINLNAMNAAACDLDAGAFKLWVYLAKNQQHYEFALSSADAANNFGLKKKQYDNAVAQLIEKGYLVNTNGLKYNFNEIPDVSKRYNEEANFSDVSKRYNDDVSKRYNDDVSKRYNQKYPKDTRNITPTTNITNNITEESSVSTSYEVEKLSIEVEPEAVETSSKEEALTEVSYSQAVSIWGDEFIINGNILTFKEGTLNYGKKYRVIGG